MIRISLSLFLKIINFGISMYHIMEDMYALYHTSISWFDSNYAVASLIINVICIIPKGWNRHSGPIYSK